MVICFFFTVCPRLYHYVFIVLCLSARIYFFFFKQKTAYEMRISDWSSDVCSSDLGTVNEAAGAISLFCVPESDYISGQVLIAGGGDRKSVVAGKSGSVRVDLGGRRMIKEKGDQQSKQ